MQDDFRDACDGTQELILINLLDDVATPTRHDEDILLLIPTNEDHRIDDMLQ